MIALIIIDIVFIVIICFLFRANNIKNQKIDSLANEISSIKTEMTAMNSKYVLKNANDFNNKTVAKKLTQIESNINHLQNAISVFNNGFVVPTQSYMQDNYDSYR